MADYKVNTLGHWQGLETLINELISKIGNNSQNDASIISALSEIQNSIDTINTNLESISQKIETSNTLLQQVVTNTTPATPTTE